MRETLQARIRNLSGVVERAMQGEAGTGSWPVALADWVLEETRAIAEDAVRDERAYWESADARALDPSQPR